MSSDPEATTAAFEAQLLLDTFRGIDLGTVWLDDQASIVLANEFFAGWAGIDAAALAGRPLGDVVEDLTPEHWQTIRRADQSCDSRVPTIEKSTSDTDSGKILMPVSSAFSPRVICR